MKKESPQLPLDAQFVSDIRRLIEETRSAVAVTVNAGLTLLYWRVGKRIKDEIYRGERADYGERILPTLSAKLTADYGRGWGVRNLAYMIKLAEAFPDQEILHTLCAKLSWSHFRLIIHMEDALKRDFYAEMCRVEAWSTRTLQKKIDSMLFERTALSKKPEDLARTELDALRDEDRMTPDIVFKDPYVLDFLKLNDHYVEKDLEDAVLRDMESFLLELGSGFAFLARQKRIRIDDDDFYIDLLLFHRGLKRLIVIDLKLGSFKAEFKGQMELYLRWLDKYERTADENPPLGIILCAGKKRQQIELLELGSAGIHVAEYMTALPPKKLLQQKLLAAVESSRKRLHNQGREE